MNPNINLREFILQNHSFMVMKDIIDETGATRYAIVKMFEELGIEPISQSQYMENAVLSMKDYLTAVECAKKLDIHESHVHAICRKLNICMLKKSLPKTEIVSPKGLISKSLHTVRIASDNHFDPLRFMGFKRNEGDQ